MKKYTFFILLLIGYFIFNVDTVNAYKSITSKNQLTSSNVSAKFQEPKAKSITLASPNGAEIWKAGSTQVIKWNSSEINFVTISYSTNNGVSWTNIESNIAASLWQYQWNIPENITPSQEFRIRISDDEAPAFFDISDNPFILTKLKILSPVTGVSFQTSRVETIKWFASADISQVDIEISLNNGGWTPIVNNYDASLGKYEYTVPDNPSSFNRIRIKNSTLPTISSISDVFRIAKIVLSSPNGGEEWYNNSTHSILWNSSSITNLGLSYSTDNGISWVVIANPISAAFNSYSWVIPSTATSQALIKVFDANDNTIYDISNANFTISTLSITSPAAITGWSIGSTKNILWTSNLSGNVKIDITTNNGTSWTQIVTGIPATQGSYTYTVPNTPTNRAKIRISSLVNPAFISESDGLFTIGNIDFVRPTGGEVFRAGDVEQILWSSTTGINLVKIEYSTDGILWNLITANAQASLGRYDWAIPSNLSSSNSFIRLSDAESDAGLEYTSSAFSITNIIITAPTGNEIYKGGTTHNITWAASPNISNVKIEFRRDDSSPWQTIVSTVATALGTYSWNIPDTLSTIYGKIRISSTSNASVNTISEGYYKVGNITVTEPNGGEKLVGNGTYNIRWSNTGSVNFVRLQYSVDGGINFINIPNASSYPAGTGVFNWAVPNILTNTAMIRISDAEGPVIFDNSDATFSIAQLSLTYPNGGQGFIPGTPINITWSSTNINNVSLDYSINNSGVWNNIVSNINAALGTYNWVIPNAPSAQVQIRISATENSSLSDINDGYFKIGSIEVLSPNGAEIYQVGTNKTIQWNTSQGINTVDIDLTTNNGTTWINLVSDYPAVGSYNWNVTNAGSPNSKIRISDSENPSILDLSDNTFSIKNITLTYPNGGNFFLVDSTININWLPSNIANVKLEYSTDNGLFWNTIVNTTPALPSLYAWKVINRPSDRVLIRISDADYPADNIIDLSDANFSINLLYVLFPDGGENFVVNSPQNVRWTAHNTVNNVRLEYTTNNGTSWSIVENSLVASTQAYTWNIPNTPTSQGRIRLIDLDNSAVTDASNSMFAIGSLLLTTPNGGQRWQVGSTHAITWNNISTVSNVDLDYTTDNGVSWLSIANNVNAALETYNWVIPNTVSALVKVRVKSSTNAALFDESDNVLSLCSIAVTLPNGGEVYQVGKNLAITWAANNVSFVNLDYSPDNGTTWIPIDNNLNAATGIYNWVIPDLPTQVGLIRIMDSQDNSILDYNNNVFKILRLELTSPDGGESYKIGMNRNITWNSSGVNALNIQYSINNGQTWLSVVDNILAVAGSYNWTVPNIPTNNFKIKIIDNNNPTVTDSSTNVFTLGNITVTEPVSGEVIQSNSVKSIKWNVTAGVQSVKIEFRLNNSSAWEVLEPAANAQQGFYNWLVPNNSSSQAKVRVSHAVNNSFIVDSSAQFTINTLNLTAPNGGEYWQAGTIKNILWNSSITGNLKIEYSLNNGTTWNIVTASVPANANLYSWNIPAALSSKQAIIKITDLNTASVKDSSTAVFKLGNVGISAPVGGELWQTGTQKIINFTNSASVDEVRIEYTLDNIIWNTIVSNYPVASGAYTWNIGNINSSSTARIRISDASSNLDINTVSNSFNIGVLDLVSPNGGELWQAETIQSIKWMTSSHTAAANIYYSVNNGVNWISITSNYACVSNDTNRYSWTVPAGISSANMLIKIENSANNTINDISASKFTIGNLAITAPTITDKLQSGRQKVITWTSDNIGNVKIDYSLDNGLTWNTIINSIAANLHLYNWTLPDNISSNQARVRIYSLNNTGVQSISNPFVISLLDVVSPNGGELWQAGSTRLIRWNSAQINSLSIYSSANNGQSWNLIAANIPAINAQYSWLIPSNSATNNAKILLVDESKISIRDSSSTAFTINSLNLTSPVGGEVWQSGTIKQITWSSLNLGPVNLDYTLDNGANWTNIISNINGALGTYSWTVPVDTASDQVRVRISEISDPTNLDISEIFTINRILVLVPNGGENWQAGSTKQISWHSRFVNNVSLAYSIDNGVNWINIADNVAANSYKINWNVPANISTSNARIKIWDTSNPAYKDSSDLRFTISNIGITAPVLNAQLQAGSNTTISWNASNLGMIDILYSLDNGGSWNSIVNNTASLSGSYVWNIPALAVSDQALIRLQSTTDPTINITSSVFKISSLEILSPNGGENWQAGSTKTITWQSSFVNNINLSYSLNNGSTWNSIVSNIPAALNSYSWTIPSNISGGASLIKITDANNSSIKDSSNTTFSISLLSITYPVGGEQLQAGRTKSITWTSSNLGLINIDYSLDNGTSWVVLANNIQSSQNSFTWAVPSNIASNQVLLRLTSVDYPTITSVNNKFIISSLNVLSPNGGENWQSNTQSIITWQSSFVNNVNLYYSLNQGNTYTLIANNVQASLGTYNWVIPANISSTNCLIKVVDANNNLIADSSDNNFTISTLNITSPLTGTEWQAGKKYSITWNSANLGLVNIDYSIDNGFNWNVLANNIQASQNNYLWTIPSNIASNQVFVRVTSVAVPSISSVSNTFTIDNLNVTSPNGGEKWQSGTTQNITWQSQFINNVNLYYSLNQGSTYTLIASNVQASLGTYAWVIPSNISSTNSIIKVVHSTNNLIADSSDNNFTLGTLGITSPLSGQEWQAGKQYPISWNAANLGLINIDYSLDNGTNWVNIISNIQSALTTYQWNVPANIASNQALIRLTSVDVPSIVTTSNVFTISRINVTAPNGGERWQTGTTQNITWQSQFINNVNLYYSINQGSNYTLIASNVQASLGTYAWAIPANITSLNSIIKIVNSNNILVSDSSDNNFTIGTLGLTSPLGGENWQAGKTYPITWSANTANSALKIEYSRDGGTNWEIVQNNVPTGSNSYLWTIPGTEGTATAKIRISDVTSKLLYQSGNFTIKQLVLNNPNGGQFWTSGTAQTIDWSSTQIANIKIEYSVNDGTNWTTIINSTPAAAGSYIWNIPVNLASSLMKVRLSDASNNLIDDYSTNSFVVGSIAVVSPNGGEILQAGITYDIKWNNSANIQDVKIEYSVDNGLNWGIVSNSTLSDGLFTWTVPENIFTNAGLIRITDINSNNLISDVSNAVFSIDNLQLVSPNGFENYQVGAAQNITWTASNNITNVTIEYFTETKGWKVIAANIAANLGTYSWLIPNDPSDSVRIRIKNSANNQVYDISNNAFRVGNVTVLAPNNLVKWQSGTIQNIQWTNTPNVKYLNLDYSIDGGINWKSIVTNLSSNSGNYKWAIPNDTTLTAKIRIVDASSSGMINDQSDVNFIINTLNIIQPVGGENWLSGSSQIIKWNSTQDIDSVSISLSVDGGNIWSEIKKVKANLGSYTWNIPNLINSNNVYLLIKDTKFGSIKDTSNKFALIPANLDLTYPVGNEYLQAGKQHYITWVSSTNVDNVKIELTTDNGTSWNSLSNSYPADSLRFKWTIPANMFTNAARIKISDVQNNFIKDSSAAVFKIDGLQITSQGGSENYQVGTTQNITWSASANVPSVNIEYSTDNVTWKTIALNVAANIGTYAWLIPNDPSNIVNIRIRSSETNNISSSSASSVRIANVLVTDPNIFQKWQVGSTRQIKWNSTNNVQNVNIYFSTNNGVVWNPVVTNTPAASGTYNWVIPDYPNITTRIKIVDALAADFINDINDTVFAISKLNLNEPEGGEIWASGSTQQIQWTASSDIDSIFILLSLDNGNVWSNLTKQKANSGSFTWIIPQSINSNIVRVLIKDSKFDSVEDSSDNFTIYPPVLTVISPNGGEYLQAGSNYYIKWQSSADVNNVKIEFRQKADTTWTILTNSYPADSLQYLWTIPSDINSNTAKIRITDVLQPFVVDSSDNYFKIGWVLVQSPNGGEHIQSGKTVNINWLASQNVNNVKIEYTINGSIWTTIVPSMAANIGTYNWTIPNTPSAFVKIRISDALSNGGIKDLSDADFTISLLQLTTPASSVQLQAGTTYQIKWNSSPEINYVNLEYTLDGTIWNIISQDSIQASLGEYLWQIPATLCSTQGKIRIWDNSSAGINDTSKYPITFKMLNITSPIGGENWQVGTTKAIRWNACTVDTITIEYSINNGQNWLLVSENVPTTANTYNWVIPNTISSNVLVRLVDKTNPQLLSVSGRFSIFNPGINLTAPNGGETWQAGTTKNIIWQSNLIDFVKIEFSSDSGSTWNTLTSSFPADSTYSWLIPNNLETRGAVIKVSDVVNTHIKDTSEVFTITELRLTSPMGGEYWQSGTQKNITWNAGAGISLVRLQYSLDNGQNWTNIAEAQNIVASVDTFKWQIPITLGTNIAKIRVMDIVDQTISSASPDTFTIGYTKVITPNGGNVFQAGNSVTVNWECSSNLRRVNVEIYKPSTNQVVVESEAIASLKTISLIIPSNCYSDSLLIRISEVNSNYLISDVSDNFISSKALELMRPVLGDNWKAGTIEKIKWEASPNNSTINIQYTSNNGVTWNPIVTNYSAILGEYDWQLPNNLSSDKCMLKIYNSVFTNIKDSSGIFNIYVPGITLLTPNGNNYYQAGNTYKIQWNSSFVTAVSIEYSSNNGVTWDTLKSPIQASLREWDWQIPNRASSSLGLIRISDYSNNTVKDVSDANFVVGWIDVVSPDGGENWLSNSSKEIRWENSNSISMVNIYYSNGDNGIDTNWVLLTSNYPTNNMPYVWQKIPNKETNRGKIRITDAKSNNAITNQSTDYFSITKLYVLSPNGGEVWYSGNTYQITWTPSININGLKIDLSTNGGRTWGVTLTSLTPAASGVFNWNVDGTLFSDSSLIRLSDVEHNEIIDISDGMFTLGAIQLRTFDNEEKVLEGSHKLITWLNSANIKFVDLLYRTKDKVWKPIKSRVPANDEKYNWLIPTEPSDSCYITIRNSDNYTFNDTSNKPFTICRMKIGVPNGGEVWQTGTSKEITWQSANVSQVYLEYSVDTTAIPITWTKILNQPILASLGKYNWEIPDDINLAGKSYRFRIYDINENKVADTSNTYSTLSYLRLLTPNSGEQTGTTQVIKWSNNINTISKVNIYVQREISDFNWTLIARNVNSDPSNYMWNINIEPSQTCRIKVEDSQNNNIYDVSDIPFTVSSIKLVYPNGGKYQKLQVGKTYDITWETSFINVVRLEFSTNNGQTWNLVPNANSIPASEKRFAWYIDDIPSKNTRLRISDANKETIFDASDTTFTICSLNLLQPNTLVAYQVGETYDITWQTVNIDTVRIQLSIDDGKTWSNLVGIADADSNRFRWKVPNLLSALARIRLSDFYESGVSDTSNSNFVIGKYPNVVLYKPYQSNIVKLIYDFLNPQETIVIERFEYQIGEGSIINTLQSLIDPPVNITGPQTDTLYWRSTDNLLDYEGTVRLWITFRSPQYNVTYRVMVDSVGVDNKAPAFTSSTFKLYQKPDKFGWNKVVATWDKGTDLSNNIKYKLSFNDINNEYINYVKETKDDSLIIPNVWSSVNYLVKIDVSDAYNNNISYILPNYKSVATCDFSGDNELNSLDLATYIKSWSSKDSTVGADLSPYDGAFPIIKVRGDSKLDIEDLLVFVNMWNYGQEYTLPKTNIINYTDKNTTREQITFKRGENNFNFPINYDKKDNLIAITAEIHYQPGVFKFDSLKIKGLMENNGISFVKNDTINGIMKIDFAELDGKLDLDYNLSTVLQYSFDRITKEDSLLIKYSGYNDNLVKVLDKSTVYSMHEIPATYKLYQNYPNPFNPTTIIEYDLPEKTKVSLVIFDILGREVALLVNEEQNVGTYRIQFDANKLRGGLASGVYFYRIHTNNYTLTQKMLLLK